MPRKATEDPEARTTAEQLVHTASGQQASGQDIIDAFETAQFETTTSKVAGAELKLRRVVLTGYWEVVK